MIFFNEEWEGKTYRLFALRANRGLWIHFAGQTWFWQSPATEKPPTSCVLKDQTEVFSPLTGRLQSLFVQKGDQVVKGQTLLVIVAMKMEYSLRAENSGTVEGVFCSVSKTVREGQKLVTIKHKEP